MFVKLTQKHEAAIRRMAGGNRCPVVVVPGDKRPTVEGERAYHTFRDSDTVVKAPGAALRKGYKLDYHASTYHVEVGRDWLIRHDWEALLGITTDKPLGVLAP